MDFHIRQNEFQEIFRIVCKVKMKKNGILKAKLLGYQLPQLDVPQWQRKEKKLASRD